MCRDVEAQAEISRVQEWCRLVGRCLRGINDGPGNFRGFDEHECSPCAAGTARCSSRAAVGAGVLRGRVVIILTVCCAACCGRV